MHTCCPCCCAQEELLLLQPGQRLERTAPRPKPYESSGKLPDPFEGTREWLTTDAEGRPLLERQDVWGWVSGSAAAFTCALGWPRHLSVSDQRVSWPPPFAFPFPTSPYAPPFPALLLWRCHAFARSAFAVCCCRSPLCPFQVSTHPPLCRCLLCALPFTPLCLHSHSPVKVPAVCAAVHPSMPPLTLPCEGACSGRCHSPLCASTHPPLCRCLLWALPFTPLCLHSPFHASTHPPLCRCLLCVRCRSPFHASTHPPL